jgi:hypothetical protein
MYTRAAAAAVCLQKDQGKAQASVLCKAPEVNLASLCSAATNLVCVHTACIYIHALPKCGSFAQKAPLHLTDAENIDVLWYERVACHMHPAMPRHGLQQQCNMCCTAAFKERLLSDIGRRAMLHLVQAKAAGYAVHGVYSSLKLTIPNW